MRQLSVMEVSRKLSVWCSDYSNIYRAESGWRRMKFTLLLTEDSTISFFLFELFWGVALAYLYASASCFVSQCLFYDFYVSDCKCKLVVRFYQFTKSPVDRMCCSTIQHLHLFHRLVSSQPTVLLKSCSATINWSAVASLVLKTVSLLLFVP